MSPLMNACLLGHPEVVAILLTLPDIEVNLQTDVRDWRYRNVCVLFHKHKKK